jgi:hypothetical protein
MLVLSQDHDHHKIFWLDVYLCRKGTDLICIMHFTCSAAKLKNFPPRWSTTVKRRILAFGIISDFARLHLLLFHFL